MSENPANNQPSIQRVETHAAAPLTAAQRAEINRTIDQALSAVQLLCRLVDRPSPIVNRSERRIKR